MNWRTQETLESWSALVPQHVYVDEAMLFASASEVALRKFSIPKWNDDAIYAHDFLAFVTQEFWRSCVNFCFAHPGQFRTEYELTFSAKSGNNVKFGSAAMGACFFRTFHESPVYANDILNIVFSLGRTKKFFKGFNDLPMIGERRDLLEEAAIVVSEKFDGDPMNILEEGRYRAFGKNGSDGVVDILLNKFPNTFGADNATLVDGEGNVRKFHFMKRAQLFVKIYHEKATQKFKRLIEDIEYLGPIPDYEIPRGYHSDGIFVYSDSLMQKIMDRSIIKAGSRMETELRAATVFAQMEELKIINACRGTEGLRPISICELDSYRWIKGQESFDYPHHVCLTTAY
ncbi:MAG: queuosine salvage family protein [bacterium]